MAKPRIFVSSTYYDLKHIRNALSGFIQEIGYDPVLFEHGDISFRHDAPLDESCYGEVKLCHMLVLIIGGRYGSPATGSSADSESIEKNCSAYNSVTKREYEEARKIAIPIYIFIEKNVFSEFKTYKENKDVMGVRYAHVDNVNVFKLIENIYDQKSNNLIKEFDHVDDIITWLRIQWAGLFAEFITKRSQQITITDLSSQINELKLLTGSLQKYSEESLRASNVVNAEKIIKVEKRKIRKVTSLSRFKSLPLINYIIQSVGEIKPNTTAGFKEILNIRTKLIISTSFDEFLLSVGIRDELRNHLLAINQANQEYIDIKKAYAIESIDTPGNDDDEFSVMDLL